MFQASVLLTPALVHAQTVTVYNTGNTPAFTSDFFQCIGVGAGDRVWAGTNGQGAYQFDGSTWSLVPGFTTNNFRDIATDANGGIWIAQSGHTGAQSITGGVRYYPGTDVNVSTSWGALTGLQSRGARSIEVDPSTGTAYVACAATITGGVSDPGGFSWGDPVNGFQASVAGLVGEDKACLAVGLVGGEVWVGADRSCETGGTCYAPRIVRYDLSGGYTNQFFDESVLPVDNSAATARIRAIKEDGSGQVWVGFSAGGVRVYSLGLQTWSTVSDPIIPTGTAVNFNAITSGPDGKVYIGTTGGLLIYNGGDVTDPASFTLLTTAEGLPANSVNQIAFDATGALWSATGAGVAKITFGGALHLVNQKEAGAPSYLLTVSSESNPQPFKVCSDGSQASVFRFICPGCDLTDVTLRTRSAPAGGISDALGGFTVEASLQDTIIARFQHPHWMNLATLYRSDSVYVVDTLSADTLFRNELRIYRAPVLLTHGFKDTEEETFNTLELALCTALALYPSSQAGYPSPLIFKNGYGATAYDRFVVNKNRVPNGITTLLQRARSEGYSAAKPIVIGHSMGGILSRLYLQGTYPGTIPYREDVSKHITINTPHRGSQAANVLTSALYNSTVSIAGQAYGLAGRLAAHLLLTIPWSDEINIPYLGAILDLRVTSKPIRNRVNVNEAAQVIVPSAVLSSDGATDTEATPSGLRTVYQLLNPNVFNGEVNDVVVALSSQHGGLLPPAQLPVPAPISGIWHSAICDDVAGLHEQVRFLINADPAANAGVYAWSGFPPGVLEYNSTMQPDLSRGSAESVQVTAPAQGATYAPGSVVDIDLQYTSGISSMTLFAVGDGIAPIVQQFAPAPTYSLQLPAQGAGRVNVLVFGSDANGLAASDSTHIFVVPSSPPDSLVVAPDTLSLALGLEGTMEVEGYFNGSTTPVLLNGTPDLLVTVNTSVLEHLGNGDVRAIALGSSPVQVSYMGVSDSMVAVVIDDPDQLLANFIYDLDEICTGDTITFADASLGLVTALEWTFAGGMPATSTDPEVAVVYDSPGEYAVTLTATFVNGTSTTVLDSLIFVVDAADTTVTLVGNALEVATGAIAYQWFDCNTGLDVPGATDHSFNPSVSGTYGVRISNGTCTVMSGCHTVISNGVNNVVQGDGLSLYPNPNDGRFIIVLDTPARTVTVEVMDTMGRSVFRSMRMEGQRIPVAFDGAPGVYSVRVTLDGVEHNMPMVKW